MNEKVLVLGLGKSGLSTVRHLTTLNIPFLVNDGAKEENNKAAEEMREKNIPRR